MYHYIFRLLKCRYRGKRFSYTHYYTIPPPLSSPSSTSASNYANSTRLTRSNATSVLSSSPSFPIHASIEALDRQALRILSVPPSSPEQACADFAGYLRETKNTICGRHPIGVLLGVLCALEGGRDGETKMEWVRYEQSSECVDVDDSSVSYASAYVVF